MPDPTGPDLPERELEAYDDEQREAFRATYRNALEEFGDKERARQIAHAAARGTPGDR
ncbi:MAG TPA: hypothetical protein VMN39_05355 [Longimicrobiaceae bacterium]|nr:hypothetical protein [Longimicrobiaceae bacterium]